MTGHAARRKTLAAAALPLDSHLLGMTPMQLLQAAWGPRLWTLAVVPVVDVVGVERVALVACRQYQIARAAAVEAAPALPMSEVFDLIVGQTPANYRLAS